MILLDDHLVRDMFAGELPDELQESDDDFATTNLWLFRLVGALARGFGGTLSGPLGALDDTDLSRFRGELSARIDGLTIVPMREIVWLMADLQHAHRGAGHQLSAAMAEALAAAHSLGATIAVAEADVGPGLRGAADADGVPFRIIARR